MPKSPNARLIEVDELVAEFEQTPAHSDALAAGRKWVAEHFYPTTQSLAALRLGKGWSQAEFARRAGTSQSYIARLELGQVDPQLSTVRKLAAALDVTTTVLVSALEVSSPNGDSWRKR